MSRIWFSLLLAGVALTTVPIAARADGPSPGGADASGPADYAKFAKGLTPQHGLFTVWRKDGKVYLELEKTQLDTDFIETAVPGRGLGGFGITPGVPYLQFPSARIVHFSRLDGKVLVTFPNTSFVAPDGTASARAVAQSFAPSVIATAPIVATDDATGKIVIDASFLLGDMLDMTNALRQTLGTDKKPQSAYHLDDGRTYFGPTKAFPENVIVEADQTFVSAQPPDVLDNAIDPRAIQVAIKYNFAAAPPLGSYMPRLADDRIGYYPNIQLEFGNDRIRERQVRTIARWNLARHPMVYYIGNTVPETYREPIREALLAWNKAFAAIGYPEAVIVKDQPDDPSWDPDDIRYNTVHWLTQSRDGGYAQAGLVWDPRTGELIHTSIVIDADLAAFPFEEYADFTDPVREAGAHVGFAAREAAYAAGAHASAMFGLAALQAVGDIPLGAVPQSYVNDFVKSIVLHESGHNWGLQHNFIGTEAYSGAQIRSKAFTSTYGLSASVMDYTPTNVWPTGTSTGDYFQTVLGPYDYHAIAWGYTPVPGATTPEAERPALEKIASAWSEPRFRFAMDEDVDWRSGHAIDPRINQFDLTDDNVGWCEAQMRISDALMRNIERRFTEAGQTHDPMRQAFSSALYPVSNCTRIAWHYIAGEELSRAHVGDPGAAPPLSPVPRAQSMRAFAFLDRHVFGANAWNVSPALMRKLVYTEWVTDLPQASWAYDPPLRHDVPIATIALRLQSSALQAMFAPVLLQRLDDLPAKYGSATMTLADLFTWTQRSVFGDLGDPKAAAPNQIRRNLQQTYARMLAKMLLAPTAGTPFDAQSLARAELTALRDAAHKAAGARGGDALARAHVAALAELADQALGARTVIPASSPPAGDGDGG